MKKIAILGSTGSIGINTLKVISAFKDKFRVVGLSTNSNIKLLKEQIEEFRPKIACVMSNDNCGFLKGARGVKIVSGLEGLVEVATHPEVDMVVMAIVGSISLMPLLEAIGAKKQVALANKEALVSGGEIVAREAKRNKVRIIPIDSEHSAIFQCLNRRPQGELKRIYLTGTGGPLRTISKRAFDNLMPAEVINHPKWKMGKKISVDSATLMNKGLEVIEAKWLFSMPLEDIEVLIHPQAVVHSMVEFIDGSILAQLSIPDMRLPIQYALGYPTRFPQRFGLYLNFRDVDKLTFSRPDTKKFPCLRLAYEAARDKGTYPAVLNAANEEAVMGYLDQRVRFTDIPRVIERVLSRHHGKAVSCVGDVLEADEWSREEARRICFQ